MNVAVWLGSVLFHVVPTRWQPLTWAAIGTPAHDL